MHPPTLFLLSLLAGILASPAHRPSWRTRRDENTRVNATTLVQQKQNAADLPPLPLEYEEEDDIYMPIDDPRVGTVDADGNVLVPVDDDGNILPGYEHLVRPVRIQMDVGGKPMRNVGQNSSLAAETLQPADKADDTQKPSDLDEATYDEAEENSDISQLPAANDYVDSREGTDDSKVVGEGAKVGPPAVGEGAKAVDENDIRPDVDAMDEERKIDEAIDEVLSPRKDELEEETPQIGKGAASENGGAADAEEEGSEEDEEETEPRSPLDVLVSEPVDDEDATDLAGLDEELSPQDVDKAIDELIKILPVDNKDDEEWEGENPLGDVRQGDVLGSQNFKAKPDSAPLIATTSTLLITFVLSLWIA